MRKNERILVAYRGIPRFNFILLLALFDDKNFASKHPRHKCLIYHSGYIAIGGTLATTATPTLVTGCIYISVCKCIN